MRMVWFRSTFYLCIRCSTTTTCIDLKRAFYDYFLVCLYSLSIHDDPNTICQLQVPLVVRWAAMTQ